MMASVPIVRRGARPTRRGNARPRVVRALRACACVIAVGTPCATARAQAIDLQVHTDALAPDAPSTESPRSRDDYDPDAPIELEEEPPRDTAEQLGRPAAAQLDGSSATRRSPPYPMRLVDRPLLLPPWFVTVGGGFGVGGRIERCVSPVEGSVDCGLVRTSRAVAEGNYGFFPWLTVRTTVGVTATPYEGSGSAGYAFRFVPVARGSTATLVELQFDNGIDRYRRFLARRALVLTEQIRFGSEARLFVGLSIASLTRDDVNSVEIAMPIFLELSPTERLGFGVGVSPAVSHEVAEIRLPARGRVSYVAIAADHRPVLEVQATLDVPHLVERGYEPFDDGAFTIGIMYVRASATPRIP